MDFTLMPVTQERNPTDSKKCNLRWVDEEREN